MPAREMTLSINELSDMLLNPLKYNLPETVRKALAELYDLKTGSAVCPYCRAIVSSRPDGLLLRLSEAGHVGDCVGENALVEVARAADPSSQLAYLAVGDRLVWPDRETFVDAVLLEANKQPWYRFADGGEEFHHEIEKGIRAGWLELTRTGSAARASQGRVDPRWQALDDAVKRYMAEPPKATLARRLALAQEVVAFAQAALCASQSPVSWNRNIKHAPPGEKLWLAIDEMEGRETLIGHCFDLGDQGFLFETYTGLRLKPYAWMLYSPPEAPAAPSTDEVME